MKNKLFTATAFLILVFNVILAQDPPPLPDAPNQGPINHLLILAVGGIIIALKRYYERTK
tara:strand:+ start:223 stop:402 length:180 start_codon:yes stop_codon:yes gene_type:complete